MHSDIYELNIQLLQGNYQYSAISKESTMETKDTDTGRLD